MPWPAAGQENLFDPARLTVSETFSFLNTAIPNAMSARPGQLPKRVLTSETELGYAATDWDQFAIAVPVSLSGGFTSPGSSGEMLSWNGVIARNLFIMPEAAKRDVFFGLSVQGAYTPLNAAVPALANTNSRFSIGLTPIVGFHHNGYELIVSPTVAFGFGSGAMTALAAAARLTRKINDTFDVGVEYAGTLGQIGAIAPPSQQAHIVYVVTDVKLGKFNFNVGAGYGLTKSSNGLAAKLGISRGF
jgi:hypothetical protein